MYIDFVEFDDGSDTEEWVCEFSGIGTTSAGSASSFATVEVEGMEHVLAAKPDIQSGTTTLLAQGAALSNFTLTIESDTVLTFGVVDDSSSPHGNRRLSATSGDLSVLVVRVTTADAAMTKQKAEISGDVFGTNGSSDTINLKSVVEDCSANVTRINPAEGTGSYCADNDQAVFNYEPTVNGGVANCEYFNTWRRFVTGDNCDLDGRGGAPQVSPTFDCKKFQDVLACSVPLR